MLIERENMFQSIYRTISIALYKRIINKLMLKFYIMLKFYKINVEVLQNYGYAIIIQCCIKQRFNS
jgi:hypothetical protein